MAVRASTRFCAALAVGCAALAPACSSPDPAVQSGTAASPVQSGTAASPVPQSTGQLPQAEPASGGCAAMDEVFTRAVHTTPQGQAFAALTWEGPASGAGAGADPQQVWQAFTAVLDSDPWKSEFEAAATDDASRHAAGALHTYVQVNQRISSGALPEYADEQQAQDDLKAGRVPAPNPEYEQAVADAADAHTALTQCMPHWPVLF